MREVKLSDGEVIQVKPLTRGQTRELEPLGITAGGLSEGITVENYGAKLDAVLLTQVSADRLEALTLPDCRSLFDAIVAETWGKREEEKNLPTPGPIAQAGSN